MVTSTVLEGQEIQAELVNELNQRIQKKDYVVRNSLNWSRKLYNEISKSVTMYFNAHKYEMDMYHIELEDLIQSVAFTLYRWKNFDPEAYQKKLYQYIIPIIKQKCIKSKRKHFKSRKNISISMDDSIGAKQLSSDSNDMTISDTIADTSYRFLEFVEDCLSRIPEGHKFYVEDIAFNTREVFRLLFNNYSGEEISDSAGVDGKKFRKMKRTLTKEFYSKDMLELYNKLPSNTEFKADYFIPQNKEEAEEKKKIEAELVEKLSGPLVIIQQ